MHIFKLGYVLLFFYYALIQVYFVISMATVAHQTDQTCDPFCACVHCRLYFKFTSIPASAASALYQPNTLCISVLTETFMNTVTYPMVSGESEVNLPYLSVCEVIPL